MTGDKELCPWPYRSKQAEATPKSKDLFTFCVYIDANVGGTHLWILNGVFDVTVIKFAVKKWYCLYPVHLNYVFGWIRAGLGKRGQKFGQKPSGTEKTTQKIPRAKL